MSVIHRRHLLGMMSGVVATGIGAGLVAGTVVGGTAPALAKSGAPGASGMPVEEKPFSWEPRILDPNEVQPIAHQRFYHNGFGCGYGVFYSIVGTMGQRWGAPYNSFPYSMMEMGKSGISEWGTVCGALLGAVAAMALFWGRKERDPMVDELFRWYETTAFPVYQPAKGLAVGLDVDLPTSVADSVLCHISVSKWSHTTGIPAQSKQRSERCARITADTAKKTVEIMNARIQGTFKNAYVPSEVTQSCTTPACHGGNPDKYAVANLKGKMDCAPCHTGSEHVQNKTVNHP